MKPQINSAKPGSIRASWTKEYLHKTREQDKMRKRKASLLKLVKGNIIRNVWEYELGSDFYPSSN